MDIELRRALANMRSELARSQFGFQKSSVKLRYGELADDIWEKASQKKCGLYLEIYRDWPNSHQSYRIRTTQTLEKGTSATWDILSTGHYTYSVPSVALSEHAIMMPSFSYDYIVEE